MIDLKKELEAMKFSIPEDSYEAGINEGIVESIEILDQYNIIAVPKTIKLSEVVSRLKETIKEEFSMEDGYRCEKAIGYYIRCFEDWDFIEIVGFDRDMKITRVGVCYEGFEWLYTLWIAGTIIEDDLQEE